MSPSAHKAKVFSSKLLSGTHKIDSSETYLAEEKVQSDCKTKESTNPSSHSHARNTRKSTEKHLIKSSSIPQMEGIGKGAKGIQRTVSITIKGSKEDLPRKN